MPKLTTSLPNVNWLESFEVGESRYMEIPFNTDTTKELNKITCMMTKGRVSERLFGRKYTQKAFTAIGLKEGDIQRLIKVTRTS